MIRVARSPLGATIGAACIVLAGVAFAASSYHPDAAQTSSQNVQVEHVMVSSTERLPLLPQPKLVVHAPNLAAAPAPAPRNRFAGEREPQIERSGSITVLASDLGSAERQVTGIARQYRGLVFSMDTSGASAQMDIRVPSPAFDSAMAAVAGIGTVSARGIDAQDVTGDLTDSSARLRNLRRTETDLLNIMDRSGRVSEILDVENQLSQVREQIETIESELRDMRSRVAFSSISVTLQPEAAPVSAHPSAAAQIASAWRTALAALANAGIALASLIVWIVVFGAPAIAAVLAVLGIYSAARRMRSHCA